MNWLNIHTPFLRSPDFIGCEPVSRATWLSVFAYCAEQENGGVIRNCRTWKDRQWQQTCGVTLAEVDGAAPLLQWQGNDLVLLAYPHEKEIEVQRMRALGSASSDRKLAAARENGSKGGRPKKPTEKPTETQDFFDNPTEKPNGNPTSHGQPTGSNGSETQRKTQRKETQETQRKPIEGEGEGERNRKEKGIGKEPPEKTHPGERDILEIRLGALFKRKATTIFSEGEKKALKKLLPLDEDDIATIENYYRMELPPGQDFRRRDLATLLHNWQGEVDRARNGKMTAEHGNGSRPHQTEAQRDQQRTGLPGFTGKLNIL